MGLTVNSNPIIHTQVKAIFFYSPRHRIQLKGLKSPFFNFQTSPSFQMIKSITIPIKFVHKRGKSRIKWRMDFSFISVITIVLTKRKSIYLKVNYTRFNNSLLVNTRKWCSFPLCQFQTHLTSNQSHKQKTLYATCVSKFSYNTIMAVHLYFALPMLYITISFLISKIYNFLNQNEQQKGTKKRENQREMKILLFQYYTHFTYLEKLNQTTLRQTIS